MKTTELDQQLGREITIPAGTRKIFTLINLPVASPIILSSVLPLHVLILTKSVISPW